MTGQFTIDQLELLQGNREFLRNIGHIQRGKHQSIIETPQVSLLCEIEKCNWYGMSSELSILLTGPFGGVFDCSEMNMQPKHSLF